jgi:anti-anti-sigma regulatory factor
MKHAEIDFTEDPTRPKTLKVSFRGDLSIENTGKFKLLLEEKIAENNAFEFEIGEVDMIDLSFYQLILSAKKTIEAQEKQFQVRMSLPDESLALLKQSGFNTDFS